MPILNPTDEQAAIFDFARTSQQSFIIDAKAGSGKTATLLDLLLHLKGTSSIQAFNRAIANELQARANRDLSFEKMLDVSISTCHSHGLSAFKRAGRKPNTLSGKLQFMFKDVLANVSQNDDIHRNARFVPMLTSAMKNSGFGLVDMSGHEHFPSLTDKQAAIDLVQHFSWDLEFEGDTDAEEVADYALDLLRASNLRTASIDFDDMIYLPLLLNLTLPQYDNMMLDEAQDINATRRELAFRSLKPGGRIIAVGDPNQAIYGFTGADVKSLENIADRASATVFPLSICWRCDGDIIESAQAQVPSIKARPNAPVGKVQTIHWSEKMDFLDLPQAGDAILCRLNKPNVAAALGLIRRGKPAKIEGRDLGKKILFHVTKATHLYAHQPLDLTLLELETYKEAEIAKLFAKKRESAIDILTDEVECAMLLIERVIEERSGTNAEYNHLETTVAGLFGDNVASTNIITLASIHKSKGREWDRVFLLGYDDYMPFHRAVKTGGWQLEQEYNLIYVGKTRAAHHLIFVNGVEAAVKAGLHRERPASTIGAATAA